MTYGASKIMLRTIRVLALALIVAAGWLVYTAQAGAATTPRPDNPPTAFKPSPGGVRCTHYETRQIGAAWRLVCVTWKNGKQDMRLAPRVTFAPLAPL